MFKLLYKTICKLTIFSALLYNVTAFAISANSEQLNQLPIAIKQIMQQDIYQYGNWGLLVKDLTKNKIIFNLNASKLFLPASVTKIFTSAALLDTYGYDYRFKTPVYALGTVQNGILKGNLVLLGQGDLTLGGRAERADKISFTSKDHIYANILPGIILTPQDPLNGIKILAKQVAASGIKQVIGNILVDTRLFIPTVKRGVVLSPIFINENLFDITVKPTTVNSQAKIIWRPQAPSYKIVNNVKTVAANKKSELKISADHSGHIITVEGTISINEKHVTKNYPIKDPQLFARAAFIQALKNEGVKIKINMHVSKKLPLRQDYKNLKPVAELISAPLSEYTKLILKVSHNIGADLMPILLAVHHGKTTYEEGMPYIGKFLTKKVGIDRNQFIFEDAVGGDGNRLTLNAALHMLEYIHSLPKTEFTKFKQSLPLLGVDGSLASAVKKDDSARGKVYAKTGTSIIFGAANQRFFLASKALAGYIEAQNGHQLAFMLVVNNATINSIQDVSKVDMELGKIVSIIYERSSNPDPQPKHIL